LAYVFSVLFAAKTANAPVPPAATGKLTTPFPLAVAFCTTNPADGLGDGEGVAVGLAVGLGDAVGLGVGLGVGVALADGLGVGVGVALGDAVGLDEGLAVGLDDAVGLGVGVGAGVGVESVEVVLNSTSSYDVPATSVSGALSSGQSKNMSPAVSVACTAGPNSTLQPAVGSFGLAGLFGS
jgi:hypothetical protein